MTAKQQHLLVMNHRISVMAIDTKHKALLFCKKQNLGTQSSVNMASCSMCVHIQKLFAKPNFTERFH